MATWLDARPLAPRARALARVFVLLADFYEREAEADQRARPPVEGAAASEVKIIPAEVMGQGRFENGTNDRA